MKKLLPLALLFLPLFVFAQPKNSGKNFRWVSEQWGIAPVGGQWNPDFGALNDSLQSWKGNDKDLFYQGMRCYGLTAFEPLNVSRGALFDASVSAGIFMPYNVGFRRTATDSLHFTMKGWHFMFSLFGKDVIPGSTVALVLSPGWDMGTFKMIMSENSNGTKMSNFYISPLARAEMRFVFGPVVVGARGCYRYDLTKGAWKNKSGPEFKLPDSQATGTSIEFFFGLGHVHFQ